MTVFYVALAALALIAFWLLVAYNGLVRARNKVGEALSGIDVQLNLRHDLVPPLVHTVAAYARHERSLLDRATRIREEAVRIDHGAMATMLENQLAATLSAVTALAERYPELAAASNFRELLDDLVEIENQVQAASAIYNSNVNLYNSMLQQVPTLWIGRAFHFQAAEFVRLDVTELHGGERAAA